MTATTLKPADAEQVREAVAWAAADAVPLEVVGAGTKRGFGRPVTAAHRLDVSGLTGVALYEAAELVLMVRPGTAIAELDRVLATQSQQLAFEPPDYGPLYGEPAGRGTIGGAIACNLAGPRRIKAGAARDHILGVKAVTGRGDAFKGGGRVMKNVTGYDMPKLLTGSFGTLAVLTEVTVKVLPAPESVATLVFHRLDDADAVRLLTAALHSAHDVSGATHLPAAVANRSAVREIAAAGGAATAIRLEGFSVSVASRAMALVKDLVGFGAAAVLPDGPSGRLWAEIRDVRYFVDSPERTVWRLSVPPAAGPAVVAAIEGQADARHFYDWGGGLVWLAMGDRADAGAAIVRAAVAAHGGGNAVLLRAADGIRAVVPVFDPVPEPLGRIIARTKNGFDPGQILNPGRLSA